MMDITLVATLNAFLMAALVLTVPALVIIGVWTAVGEFLRG
ncbi:hypothetical protein [Nesterenkonia lutea]|uniref:Uncharacterized protein n=1 Tax=Nesterenkonia lutea TaxID=272919 RepID=A0ABR9JIK0_9MICC|nr:hypothetical protein [Nesterenkonia lutea]MBE1525357.1 hypothetical protein [Nesterenkonia lutea]